MNLFNLLLILLFSLTIAEAKSYIDDTRLWKHVVTLDRLVWEKRDKKEKVNDYVKDDMLVRRLYVDIAGRIPTYAELNAYLKNKDIDKRKKLIDQLLSSPGYVSNFTNFWLEIIRIDNRGPDDHYYNELHRHIERCLYENRSYDEIVKGFLLANGSVHHNQAIGYYLRDRKSGFMDTVNATVRAFLGTRIGCAQCHNHRFDKWTQKEFYETATFLKGLAYRKELKGPQRRVLQLHRNYFNEDKKKAHLKSPYLNRIFVPSLDHLVFKDTKIDVNLHYPSNYVYDNAEPNELVKPRIVFDYGDQELVGESKREQFVNWLTSKQNPMFSKIMANRLWKRIMGVAIFEPVDDWKENLDIENPKLFEFLGSLFSSLNYDMKAFLTVILNSEAYQLSVNKKYDIRQDNYKFQGAILKRMSAEQLYDSLLLLQHGSLDVYAKLSPNYFEFEDKLNELIIKFKNEVYPIAINLQKSSTFTMYEGEFVKDDDLYELFTKYAIELKKLQDYYDIQSNGYERQHFTKFNKEKITNNSKVQEAKVMTMGSMAHATRNDKGVKASAYSNDSLLIEFGSTDRSAPDTNVNTDATMKQILKMMNSEICRKVASKESYLMKNMMEYKDFSDKIKFLYLSLYGRSPTGKDMSIAKKYIDNPNNSKLWSNYILALINSPEFYFVK